jgi:hypothetical protein
MAVPRAEMRPPPLHLHPRTPVTMSYSDDMAAFYDAWAGREEELAAALAAALPSRRPDVLASLVDAAYYEHKSRLADRHVVAALDPRWLNPLERAFLWAWGGSPRSRSASSRPTTTAAGPLPPRRTSGGARWRSSAPPRRPRSGRWRPCRSRWRARACWTRCAGRPPPSATAARSPTRPWLPSAGRCACCLLPPTRSGSAPCAPSSGCSRPSRPARSSRPCSGSTSPCAARAATGAAGASSQTYWSSFYVHLYGHLPNRVHVSVRPTNGSSCRRQFRVQWQAPCDSAKSRSCCRSRLPSLGLASANPARSQVLRMFVSDSVN